MGATQTLCEYAYNLRYEALPREVVNCLKLHLLDAVGAALYGYHAPWSKQIRDYWLELAGPGKALVWGSSISVPAPIAATVNATATHAFELDDRRVAAYMHPACGTLPAALAVADVAGGVPGRNLITAIAAGYEVGLRIGKCIGVGGFARGFYTPAISQGFAGAIAAGILQGVDADTMAHVLHVVATQSSGLYSPTAMKRLNTGNGAFHSVTSVDLVKRGLRGLPDILEREVNGVCRAFLDNADLTLLTNGLGKEYEALRVELKPYVSSRPCHTTIDASLALRKKHPRIEDIDKIEIVINEHRYRLAQGFGDPTDVPSALMSVRYCAVIATLDGDVWLEQFTEEKVKDGAVRGLLAKAYVTCDPKLDKIILEGRDYALVRWHLKNGTTIEEERTNAKGHPDDPMSEEEVRRKFHRLMDGVIGPQRANDIESAFNVLDEIDSIALQRLLKSPYLA